MSEQTAADARTELLGMLSGLTIAWSVSGRTVGFITGFQSGLEVGGFAVVTTPDGAITTTTAALRWRPGMAAVHCSGRKS